MNELFLYQLYQNIFKASSVIEGRFAVLKSAADINTSNFDELVKDAISGLVGTRKYPVVLLLPIFEQVPSYERGWATMRNHMFFLTADKRNGDGSIKAINTDLNASEHPAWYDWKDMREVAGNFRTKFNEVVRSAGLLTQIRELAKGVDTYSRVSMVGNDRLNGVGLQFNVEMFICPTSVTDYDPAVSIPIPDLNIHPLHKL